MEITVKPTTNTKYVDNNVPDGKAKYLDQEAYDAMIGVSKVRARRMKSAISQYVQPVKPDKKTKPLEDEGHQS